MFSPPAAATPAATTAPISPVTSPTSPPPAPPPQPQQQPPAAPTPPAPTPTAPAATPSPPAGPAAAILAATAPPKQPEKQDRRKMITAEIVSTEESYLRALEAMAKVWVEPLMASAQNDPNPILTMSEIQTIFCNVTVFYEFHKRFVSDMKICNNDISSNSFGSMAGVVNERERRISVARGKIQVDSWGALFLTFAPFLKMYTQYLNNHATAVQFIEQLVKSGKNKKFLQFYKEANADPRCFGNSVQSLLIQPVQRVPRYKLLLAELLKNTPKNHADYNDLNDSHDQVGVVALSINSKMREQEHQHAILALQNEFSKPTELVAPGRVLIHSGKAIKRGERMDNEYFFVLFNDLFIYCSGSSGKYNCHRQIPITPQFTVTDHTQPRSAKNKALEYSLMIHNESKSFQLILPTKQELDVWQSKFNEVLQKNEEKLKSRKSYTQDRTLIKTYLPIFDLRFIRRHSRRAIKVGLFFGDMSTNVLMLIIITFLYIYFGSWTLAAK